MLRKQIKKQLRYFPALTMLIVFFLGINIGLTMVRPPEFLPRKPSSMDTETGPVVNNFEISALVDLGCGFSEKIFVTDTPLVRLKGCLSENGLPAEVINRTTGVTATVLEGDDFFTTDYFHLGTGTNIISVTYIRESGEAQIVDYKIRVEN